MDYTTCIHIIALLVAISWRATAAPTRAPRDTRLLATPSWHRPCDGSTERNSTTPAVTVSSDTVLPFDAHTQFKNMRSKTRTAKAITDRILNKMRYNRSLSHLERDLEGMILSGLPIVPHPRNITQDLDVNELLRETHTWIMRFAAYMEELLIVETDIEETIRNITLVGDITLLEKEIIPWMLCQLQLTMEGTGVSPRSLIGRDILDGFEMRANNSAITYTRNFIVMRDLRKALHYIDRAFGVVVIRIGR